MKLITIPTVHIQEIVDKLLQKPKKPADITSFCSKIDWDALAKPYTNGKDAELDRTLFNTKQPYAGYLTATTSYSLDQLLAKCRLITVQQRLSQLRQDIQNSFDKGLDWTYVSECAKEAVKLRQNTKTTRLFSIKTYDLDWGWMLQDTKPITNQEVAERLTKLMEHDKADSANQPAPKEIAYAKVIQRNEANITDVAKQLKTDLPFDDQIDYYVKAVDYNPDWRPLSSIDPHPDLAKAVDDINHNRPNKYPIDSPYLLIRLNDYCAIVIVGIDSHHDLAKVNTQLADKLTYYDWFQMGTFGENMYFKDEPFQPVEYDQIVDKVKQMMAAPVKA